MKVALAKHDSLLRGIFLIHNGHIVKITGDGFHVAFVSVSDAVHATIHSQQAIQGNLGDTVIRVRMGCIAEKRNFERRLFWSCLNRRLGRVCRVCNQALVSSATAELIGKPANQSFLI
jgi:hypothetical protein